MKQTVVLGEKFRFFDPGSVAVPPNFHTSHRVPPLVSKTVGPTFLGAYWREIVWVEISLIRVRNDTQTVIVTAPLVFPGDIDRDTQSFASRLQVSCTLCTFLKLGRRWFPVGYFASRSQHVRCNFSTGKTTGSARKESWNEFVNFLNIS